MVKSDVLRQQELRDRRKAKLENLMDTMFEDTEIYKAGDRLVIEWNITPQQWPIIHRIAELKGLTTDAMLEKIGRDIINKRSTCRKSDLGNKYPTIRATSTYSHDCYMGIRSKRGMRWQRQEQGRCARGKPECGSS